MDCTCRVEWNGPSLEDHEFGCPWYEGERETQVTDEMIERASRAIEATFHFLGLPGTRMPGTESVDCQMVARVALEAAMGGGVMEMDR